MASRAATQGTGQPGTHPGQRGQPTALTRPVALHAEVFTQGEAIARLVRTGLSIKDAAKACGLESDRAYKALGDGRVIAGALHAGTLTPDGLTTYQQAAHDYYLLVDKAEAEATALHTSALARHAQGGHKRRREVVTYDAAGNETGRQVVEEDIPPLLGATTFWLERRRPDLFGRVDRHELVPPAGETTADTSPLDRLNEALDAIARRSDAAAAVIDVHEAEGA